MSTNIVVSKYINAVSAHETVVMFKGKPSNDSAQFCFKGQTFFNRYEVILKGELAYIEIQYNDQTDNILINMSDRYKIYYQFHNAYELYMFLRWENDGALAYQWESDPVVQNFLAQKKQNMIDFQSQNQWGQDAQQGTFFYQPLKAPLIDIDFIMDSTVNKNYLKLDKFIFDKNSALVHK